MTEPARKPPIAEAPESEKLSPAALICLSQRKRPAQTEPARPVKTARRQPMPPDHQSNFCSSVGG